MYFELLAKGSVGRWQIDKSTNLLGACEEIIVAYLR
jgi:hypothetical protein